MPESCFFFVLWAGPSGPAQMYTYSRWMEEAARRTGWRRGSAQDGGEAVLQTLKLKPCPVRAQSHGPKNLPRLWRNWTPWRRHTHPRRGEVDA
jgi:hypothetical protein